MMNTWAWISKLARHTLLALMLATGPALGEKKYGPAGVTDTEIQDRSNHAIQRPGVGFRHNRPGAARLLRQGQRGGRCEWTKDQADLIG